MCVCVLSHDSTAAMDCSAKLIMEFSEQEDLGGLSFPIPWDLPNSGTDPSPMSSAFSKTVSLPLHVEPL